MALNLKDFPDLKFFKIEDSVNSYAIAENRILTHFAPSRRIAILTAVQLTPTQAATINEMFIDDQKVLGATASLISTRLRFNQADMQFGSGAPSNSMAIPFRKSVRIDITQGATAGTHTWQMWALLHQDAAKDFEAAAGQQGG